MSKKTENTEQTQQPDFVRELLEKGTAMLTANTRDELAKMVNDIPADVKYGAGAVGYSPETGLYSLRIDLTSK